MAGSGNKMGRSSKTGLISGDSDSRETKIRFITCLKNKLNKFR